MNPPRLPAAPGAVGTLWGSHSIKPPAPPPVAYFETLSVAVLHRPTTELDPDRFPRALGDLLAARTLGELEVEDMKGRYLG